MSKHQEPEDITKPKQPVKPMIFESKQAFTILKAAESRRLASLALQEDYRNFQAQIVACDLSANEILLHEDLLESLPTHRADSCKAFLKIKTRGCFPESENATEEANLVLELRFLQRFSDMSSWKITGCAWRQNKRWLPRVCFAPHRSPKAVITREFRANVDGELHDLSEEGLAITFWNKNLRNDFKQGETIAPKLIFNQHFMLSTECKVVAAGFVRQPCCHTRLRLLFNKLTQTEKLQLQLLIDNLSARDMAA